MVQWDRGGQSTIQCLERGHPCRNMVSGLIPIFNLGQITAPLVWPLVNETAKVLLYVAIHDFYLWVVCRTKLQFSAR
jgi:hypothetical protein